MSQKTPDLGAPKRPTRASTDARRPRASSPENGQREGAALDAELLSLEESSDLPPARAQTGGGVPAEEGLPVDPSELARQFLRDATHQQNFESQVAPPSRTPAVPAKDDDEDEQVDPS